MVTEHKATSKRKAPPRYATAGTRKPTANAKEAASENAARSGTTRSRKSPSKPGAIGEALWNFFSMLSKDEQSAFARRLLADPEWFEDIYDSISVIEADKEPSRPLDEYMAEYLAKDKKKRPK